MTERAKGAMIAMAGTFSRSRDIIRESLRVLRKDRELLLFPSISSLVTTLLGVTFFFLATAVEPGNDGSFINSLYCLAFFSLYLLGYFVVMFFKPGLIACAQIRLSGGDPKFSDGMRCASANLRKIAGWALFSATVGILLLAAGRRNFIEKIESGLERLGWNLVTFFVIPVMVFEQLGVKQSVK